MQRIKRASLWQKIAAGCMIFGLLAASVGYYISYDATKPQLRLFDIKRDLKPVVDIFNTDLYWLTTNPDYSPEFMLKYRATDQNMASVGRLTIWVLEDKGEVVGFTAYYMLTPQVGQVLFVAVKRGCRGKRYGEMLVRHAIKKLLGLGAKKVRLFTRLDNISAQTLYKRVGFVEVSREGVGMYFEYTP